MCTAAHHGGSWLSSHRRCSSSIFLCRRWLRTSPDTLLRILDFPIAEQVIAVPTVSCASCPSRSRVPEPQSADQLVEVPTVLTPTRIALQIAEQIVDTPVPRALDHGSLPGQSSSSRREDERAEVPKIRLLLRMGTDSMRYRVSLLQPLALCLPSVLQALGSSGVTGPLLL